MVPSARRTGANTLSDSRRDAPDIDTTRKDARQHMMAIRFDRRRAAAVHDLVMAAASFVLSLYLRLGDEFWNQTQGFLWEGTVIFTVVSGAVFSGMHLYRGVWRYASINDLMAIAKAATIIMLVFLLGMFLLTRLDAMPRSTLAINWLVLVLLLGGPRLAYRLLKDGNLTGIADPTFDQRVPVVLIGAGDMAELFLREMQRPGQRYRVVGLVDDDPRATGRHIHGVPVLGTPDTLDDQLRKLRRKGHPPRRLLISDPHADGATVGRLLETADAHGMTLARLPRLTDFRAEGGAKLEIKPVAIEDLLGRPQVRLDRDAMARLIGGRCILVTGAGGTIGGELTRQVVGYGPKRVVLLDNAEFNLYQIDQEIAARAAGLSRRAVLGDVRDSGRLRQLFAQESPDLVLHAAAIKHVPIAETNICESVLTNVIGTRNVAAASRAAGVAAMLLISTDKAVNPSSVMGATKRLAESYCQALDGVADTETRFVTVRFGNVLGSTGSVVPLFQKQLAAGGPLTVTHPEMTRYFMTTREAVELVLQATAMGLGGAGHGRGIFVLEMGAPLRIDDLARQMIRLAGLRPGVDVGISYVGLRPGEKLHEQLFHESETLQPTPHESIRFATPRAADAELLERRLEELEAHARHRRVDAALGLLTLLVPEYHRGDDEPVSAVQ